MAARAYTERHYFCMCSSINIDHSLNVSIVPGDLYLPSQQLCNPTPPSGGGTVKVDWIALIQPLGDPNGGYDHDKAPTAQISDKTPLYKIA